MMDAKVSVPRDKLMVKLQHGTPGWESGALNEHSMQGVMPEMDFSNDWSLMFNNTMEDPEYSTVMVPGWLDFFFYAFVFVYAFVLMPRVYHSIIDL